MDLNTYSTVDLAERLKISLDLLMLVSMTQNGLSTIWASYASLSTTFSLSSLLLDAVRTIRRRAAAPECTWKSWFLLIRRAIVHLCTCAPLVANLSANSTHVTREAYLTEVRRQMFARRVMLRSQYSRVIGKQRDSKTNTLQKTIQQLLSMFYKR